MFSAADLAERQLGNEYREAYEALRTATSTEWAPWYVVPADQKWATRAIVAHLLDAALKQLDLRYPEMTKEKQQALLAARRQLENE